MVPRVAGGTLRRLQWLPTAPRSRASLSFLASQLLFLASQLLTIIVIAGLPPHIAANRVVSWGQSTSTTNSIDGSLTIVDIQQSDQAFAALTDSGRVLSWGPANYGGDQSSVDSTLQSDVTEIKSIKDGFLAVKNSSYVFWGFSTTRNIDRSIGGMAKQLEASDDELAVLLNNGSVKVWLKNDGSGRNVPEINEGVTSLAASGTQIACLKSNGTIVLLSSGTGIELIFSERNNVFVDMFSNDQNILARRQNGSVIQLDRESLAPPPLVSNFLSTNNITSIANTDAAFAALSSDGAVRTWGRTSHGGNSDSVQGQLQSGVRALYATRQAFVAIKDNGIVTWGDSAFGGDSSSISRFGLNDSNILQLAANGYAFAALTTNRSYPVVAWGNTNRGGDVSGALESIVALNGNAPNGANTIVSHPESQTFALLNADQAQLITWGNTDRGGNSSTVSTAIEGKVVKVAINADAMAALTIVTQSPTTSAPTTTAPTSSPRTIAPSTNPTASPKSVSPTSNPTTISPTVDFANGPQVSDNMKIIDSARDTSVVIGTFIVHSFMDAIVTTDVARNQTVLLSSVLNTFARGYLGVKVWRELEVPVSAGRTRLEKTLVAQVDMEWENGRCELRGQSCEELPLTDATNPVAFLEFRAPNLFSTVPEGGRVENPYLVSWVDPTGIVRSMKPVFNDVLVTYNASVVSEGTAYDFDNFWEVFGLYFTVLFILIGCMMALLGWACFRLYNKKTTKSRDVLDTRQYETIVGKVPRRVKRDEKYEYTWENRIKSFHCAYITLVAGVQIVMTLMLTLTFYAILFFTINQQHFDVLKQYPDFAESRDAQLALVLTQIDVYYRNEIDRIDDEYNFVSSSCSQQSIIMQNAYDANRTAIRNYHDQQFQNPPLGASTIEELSVQYACNIFDSVERRPVYERNEICETFKGAGQGLTTWCLDPKIHTEEQVTSNLTNWCKENHWCVGYSYDRENLDYYVFSTMPLPLLSSRNRPNGTCFAATRELWPTLEEIEGNLTGLQNEYIREYENEVFADIADTNRLLNATRSPDNVLTVFLDRSPPRQDVVIDSYNQFESYTRTNTTDTTTRREVRLQIPNVPEMVNVPVLRRATELARNISQAAQEVVNRTNETVSILDQLGIEVLDVNVSVTIPKVSDYVKFPSYTFPNFEFIRTLILLILVFDLTWVIIRWILIAISTAQYIVGIRVEVPGHRVGKSNSVCDTICCKWACGCICARNCYNCLKRIDTLLWNLLYKIFRIFVILSLTVILIVFYIIVSQVLRAETLGAFGVFDGMTLQQELQRTIRNEEISLNANGKNQLGSNTLRANLETTGFRLIKEGYQFNLEERARVDAWNERYCAAASEYVLGIHTLTVGGEIQGFPTRVNDRRLFNIERDTFGISQYYVDRVTLGWRYNTSNGTVPDNTEMRYRIFLTDTNSTFALSYNGTNTTYPNITASTELGVLAQESYLSVNEISTTFTDILAFYMGVEIVSGYDPNWYLQTVVVGGRGLASDFVCPKVRWRELFFQPNNYLGICARLDPIHGRMMRIFDRDDWRDALQEGHRPFIDAFRSIALSPFVILMGMAILFAGVYMLIAILETIFMWAGLIRADRFAAVPVIIRSDSQAPSRASHSPMPSPRPHSYVHSVNPLSRVQPGHGDHGVVEDFERIQTRAEIPNKDPNSGRNSGRSNGVELVDMKSDYKEGLVSPRSFQGNPSSFRNPHHPRAGSIGDEPLPRLPGSLPPLTIESSSTAAIIPKPQVYVSSDFRQFTNSSASGVAVSRHPTSPQFGSRVASPTPGGIGLKSPPPLLTSLASGSSSSSGFNARRGLNTTSAAIRAKSESPSNRGSSSIKTYGPNNGSPMNVIHENAQYSSLYGGVVGSHARRTSVELKRATTAPGTTSKHRWSKSAAHVPPQLISHTSLEVPVSPYGGRGSPSTQQRNILKTKADEKTYTFNV